jgi:hypothetical protein
MPNPFPRSDFGPAKTMHGGAVDREIHHNSDLTEQTGALNVAYVDIARSFGAMNETLKSPAAVVQRRGGAIDGSYAAAAAEKLAKAKRLLIKAESDDPEDRDESDEEPAVEIERLLKKVKKLLLAAHEADEDVDDTFAAYTKAKVSLATLKAKTPAPAAVAAAKDDAANARLAKAAQELDRQVTTLQGGLAECVALLSKRNGGLPAPRAHIMKAEGAANDTGPAAILKAKGLPSNADIEAAIESGALPATHGADARMIRNIPLHDDLVAARARRDASSITGIRTLFANI